MKSSVKPRSALALSEFKDLFDLCEGLTFEPHQIANYLDAQGRDELALDREFPFHIRLFRFRTGEFRMSSSWHERLELLLPLDGPMRQRMGEAIVDLNRGD